MGERIRGWYCENCDTEGEIKYQEGLDNVDISILVRDAHQVKSPSCCASIDEIIHPLLGMSSE